MISRNTGAHPSLYLETQEHTPHYIWKPRSTPLIISENTGAHPTATYMCFLLLFFIYSFQLYFLAREF